MLHIGKWVRQHVGNKKVGSYLKKHLTERSNTLKDFYSKKLLKFQGPDGEIERTAIFADAEGNLIVGFKIEVFLIVYDKHPFKDDSRIQQ